ncbi:hypothetical protein F2Q69_00034501 [Brassica cretica]|uniref:Transmembrane 9 superfamily member n=1 Tax=Brassica cretica TaxID=69181 RepID=A0A8S9SHM8_BRACR|nr:hypothetical protein F2Q69_00034501 [Brassica cretica]
MMMKTAGGAITIFGLMISFFLCAITASGFVSGEKEIVLDTIGRPVEFYAPYHAYFERPGANALICRYGSIETSGFSCPQRVGVNDSRREDGSPRAPPPSGWLGSAWAYAYAYAWAWAGV